MLKNVQNKGHNGSLSQLIFIPRHPLILYYNMNNHTDHFILHQNAVLPGVRPDCSKVRKKCVPD